MQTIYLINRVLSSPLEALFTLLIFILSKELNATTLQLTILASIKPLTSLWAFVMSSFLVGRPNLTRLYLLACILIGSCPCLLFAFSDDGWLYIASYAFFMTTTRSSMPAWIEILKNQRGSRNKIEGILAKGSSLNYAMMMIVPFLLSNWLDQITGSWKNFLFIFGILSLLNIPFLFVTNWNPHIYQNTNSPNSISTYFLLKERWRLCKTNRFFVHYQILFFLGGCGVVIVQPILPIYFHDNLQLSYSQLIFAFSLCKGLAFICSSHFWVQWVRRGSLYLINGTVNLLSSLFIGFILASSADSTWLLLAYLLYGSMQAGCELSWNLSGPYFAQNKESVPYSSLNLFFVGLRGCLCPFLGQFIFLNTNAFKVLIVAGFLCLISSLYAFWLENHYQKSSSVSPLGNYV